MATIENLDPEYIPLSEEIEQVTQQEPEPLTGEFTSAGVSTKDLRSPNFIEGQQGWRLNSNGIAEFTGLIVKDSIFTVKLNDSIQEAIDTMSDRGGGIIQLQSGTYIVTHNLIIKDNITIKGIGIDGTVLDFNNTSFGILAKGTSTDKLVNWSIENLTVQNSNNDGGIWVDYSENFELKKVKIDSCGNDGVFLERSKHFVIQDCQFISNLSQGLTLSSVETSGLDSAYGYITNCYASSNSNNGFLFKNNGTSNDTFHTVTYINCSSINNGACGFSLLGNSSNTARSNLMLLQCISESNGTDGFYCSYIDGVTFIGCSSSDNSDDGFSLSGFITMIGCIALGNGGTPITYTDSTVSYNLLGNTVQLSGAPSDNLMTLNMDGNVLATTGGGVKTERTVIEMGNWTGGSLSEGTVVVTATSGVDKFVTTTTQGDDRVVGMVVDSIPSLYYGGVLIEGFTTKLKVDGTTDISIGDFLCTSTVAGVAMKASAGDMVFAIAEEAYSTNDSNGVIDALLIKPRKI